MKIIDMRFNKELLKNLVGKTFYKYVADSLVFGNMVTGVVGLSIDNKLFALNNIQETVDYFGNTEDCGVFKFHERETVSSFFEDVKQQDTPVNEKITRITIINENQRIIKNGICLYDVRLTRCIIFHFNGYEISFQKDIVPFSEEIIVKKGHKLLEKIDGTDEFMKGWGKDINPCCVRENIVLQ